MRWTLTTRKPVGMMRSKPPKDDYRTPFFMLFPWGRVAGFLMLLTFVMLFIYRLSHSGGQAATEACFAAMVLAFAAGVAAIYPVGKFWGGDQWRMLLGIFLGILIRLLIGGVGVIIITLFTTINQILFVLFLKLYYFLLLIGDTWLAVWMLRHSPTPESKESVNGNLWDIVERV